MNQRFEAIETRYAGCRFRSRLEARWAVFFDALNVRWDYEPEGFVLGTELYLPDFWLPDIKLWVEVKGAVEKGDNKPLTLCEKLHIMTEWPVALVVGSIGNEQLTLIAEDSCESGGGRFVDDDSAWSMTPSDTLTVYCEWVAYRKDRVVWGPGYQSTLPHFEFALNVTPRLLDAYTRARSARFEHGENG